MTGCNYFIKTGPRKNEICGGEILRDDRCQTHLILKEFDTKLDHCKHKFLKGERTGCYCPMSAAYDGLCGMHCHITEPSRDHCQHKFGIGYRKGCYCPD